MAAFDPANSIDTTDAQDFIPELWSDEIIVAYESNLVLAANFTRIDHVGKRGDTIHIPKPTRGAASVKAQNSPVTLIAENSDEITISLDQWWHYARLIEGIVDVQALPSMRSFYTQDAGYALAKQVDTRLFWESTAFQSGTRDVTTPIAWDAAVIGGDGSTTWSTSSTGNGTALTDAGIREMMQLLDDEDIPGDDRFWVVPPVEKKNLLGLSRFTEQAFVGEGGMANSIRSGRIGQLYGAPVYVSTNCPTVTNASGTVSYRVGIYAHRSAVALAMQQEPRVLGEFHQEHLSHMLTADSIWGARCVRPEAGVAFVVPA